jgi:hypothetical protein
MQLIHTLTQRILKPLGVGAIAVLFVSSVGWLADSILDPTADLLESLGDLATKGGFSRLFLPALLVIVFGTMLYLTRKAFIPVQNLAPVVIQPKQGFVLFLSPLNKPFSVNEGGIYVVGEQNAAVPLSGNSTQDARANLSGLNWQQLVRAIEEHTSTLESICLICSAESEKQFELAAAFLKHYLPRQQLRTRKSVCDFWNVEQMYREINIYIKAEKKHGIKEDDIIVDVTGGYKTSSIAGAMATLAHPGLMFQYVSSGSRHDDFKTIGYNAVNQSDPDFS